MDFLKNLVWSLRKPTSCKMYLTGKLRKIECVIEYGNHMCIELLEVTLKDGKNIRVVDDNLVAEREFIGRECDFEISCFLKEIKTIEEVVFDITSIQPTDQKASWYGFYPQIRNLEKDHLYVIKGKITDKKEKETKVDFGHGYLIIPTESLNPKQYKVGASIKITIIHHVTWPVKKSKTQWHTPSLKAKVLSLWPQAPYYNDKHISSQTVQLELENGCTIMIIDNEMVLNRDFELIGRTIEVEVLLPETTVEWNPKKWYGAEWDTPSGFSGAFFGKILQFNSSTNQGILDLGLGETSFKVKQNGGNRLKENSFAKISFQQLGVKSIKINPDPERKMKSISSAPTRHYFNLENALREPTRVIKLSLRNQTDIPKEIKKLKKLAYLDLSGNPYLDFGDALQKISGLKKLTHLTLSQNGLKTIPKNIKLVASLKKLDVGMNSLISLPLEISRLKNLEEINAKSNKILYTPKEIGKLKRLKKIDLSYNLLTELPNEIGEAKGLQEVLLEANQIIHLPESIGNLIELRVLNIRNNRLDSQRINEILSYGMREKVAKELENFEWKNVGESIIQKIPANIGNLENLRNLDLSGFAFKDIPTEIKKLGRLQKLTLVGSYLTNEEKQRVRESLPKCEIEF